MANSHFGTMGQPERHPLTAAALSVIPGLGQLYVGDKRKGILFLDVAAINYILLAIMCCSAQITMALRAFAVEYRFDLNHELLNALNQAHFGSPASMFMFALMILFVLYAARDAYDKAFGIKRRQIYGDSILDFSEATSGSYLGHVALMLSCLVLAAFFVHPPARIVERAIVFDLEQATPIAKVKPITNTRSTNDHERHGRKQLDKPKIAENKPKSAQMKEPAAENKPVARAEAKPTQEKRTPVPMPEPALKPTPTTAVPQPAAPSVAKAAVPVPAAPTPVRAVAPTANPAPAAPRETRIAPPPSLHPALAPMVGGPFVPNPKLLASSLLPPVPHVGPVAVSAPMPHLAVNAAGGRTGAGLPAAPMPRAVSGVNTATAGLPNALPFTGFGSAPRPAGFGSGHRIGAVIPEGLFTPLPRAATSGGGGTTGSGDAAPALAAVNRKATGAGATAGESTAPSPIRFKAGPSGSGGSFMVAPTVPATGTKGGSRGEATNPSRDTDDKEAGEATRKEINWSAYMADLQRRIKKSWFPPRHSENLRAVTTFTIHTDGTMSNLRITHSGGLSLYDDAALKAIQTAMPFKHLPEGAPDSVDIEFTFDFNVFNSRSDAPQRRF